MASNPSTAPAPIPQPQGPPAGRPKLVSPAPKPPRAGRWIALGFVVFAVLAGWAFVRSASKPARRPAAAVRTGVVRKDSIRRTARLTGVTVAGRFSMLLAPSLTGTRSHGASSSDFQQILLATATPGSVVRKGTVVAEFERMYMLRRLDDYKAVVVQSEANLRSLNALLDMRRANYDQLTTRYRGARDKTALDLQKAPVLSAIQAEKNRLTNAQYEAQLKEIVAEEEYFIESEKSSIRRSELSYEISKLELQRAQRNADSMLVKAPLDGMIVMQTIRRGSDTSEIRGGDQLYPGQPFMQIIDQASMGVMAAVNQVDIDSIRVGAAAKVTFDAYPGLELPARVVSVGAMANSKGWRANWVKEVPVKLQLQKLDPRVIPNFTVAADVVLEETGEVSAAPRESIFTDPNDGKTVAFVRGPSGWEKRDVAIGAVSNTVAEIKAGLNLGDVVAVEWPLSAPDGSANPRD